MSAKIEENAITELQNLMLNLHQNERRLNEFLDKLPPRDSEILRPKINPSNNKDLQPNVELYQLSEQAMEIGYEIQIILKELKTTITLAEAKITTSSDMRSTVRQQLLVILVFKI